MVAETLREFSDRQLVERFLDRQDEAVFEALVRRHGPMVYRVCARVLRQTQDCEDAFQATFLLLAQRIRSVRKLDSLASWLHGVAQRVSLKARACAATRRRHEQAALVESDQPPADATWSEVRMVLDAELQRLPEKWRLPLVLCYLEGQTQVEAAAQAGWSKSTLRRRLDEAREALARRLQRRGVLGAGAIAAILLCDCEAPAAVPSGLVGSVVETAARLTTGQMALAALVSTRISALTEGVTTPMILSKFKIVLLFGMLAVLLTGAGFGMFGTLSPAAEPGQDKKESPEKPTANKPQPADKSANDGGAKKLVRNCKGFSFEAQVCKGDPLDGGDVTNVIGGLSGSCVPNSNGWFRLIQEKDKVIDGEQIVPGYLICTNFEPAKDGKIRLRLTLEHVGLELDTKDETVVHTSFKQVDRLITDGATVQLRFGKSASRDVWLRLTVKEEK
jgi:RNA polymerase sigma factor (sigma-70 family)